MKKTVSVLMAFVLFSVSLIYSSSSKAYTSPEIFSVKINEETEYGLIDYDFVDNEGNQTAIFDFSHLELNRRIFATIEKQHAKNACCFSYNT